MIVGWTLTFWKSSPETVEQLTIEQVVSNAGDGVLKDNSSCSAELREYLAQIPSSKVASYIEQCLSAGFSKGGMVLQDLVNELGRRLDYAVENGRYQGTINAIGFDGLWLSPQGHATVVEVKTTDAYRILLDTIVGYRNKLLGSGKIAGSSSSILIVVGREDTGELEAQVRGSRHAWDIRLISADALIKMVQLKENTEGTETGLKIRSLLAPMEYTRLDAMIDVMFTTAKDVEGASALVENGIEKPPQTDRSDEKERGIWQFTDSRLLQDKRDQIVAALGRHTGAAFIKKSRALFWDAGHSKRLVCTISKRYSQGANRYWFAYHPQWQAFLSDGREAYLALGCMDLPCAFAVPLHVMTSVLDALNTTTKDDGQVYWHIHIVEPEPGRYAVLLPKKSGTLPLEDYRLTLNA